MTKEELEEIIKAIEEYVEKMGIPHYANAIDNIKNVDMAFDSFNNEIKDGRKRIFARADMFNYDDGRMDRWIRC